MLITGASGFLGWNLCRQAVSDWDVAGIVHKHQFSFPGIRVLSVDLTAYKELHSLFTSHRPDAVIHAAALADPNKCQVDPESSRKINVEASQSLAGLCADAQIPCVFTSTDLVFDGKNPPYKETDAVCPISLYGEHKVIAEQDMVARWPQTVICRMPLMFGNPGPVARSSLQPIIECIQEKRELRMFVDEFRTPVGGQSAASGLIMALDREGGILHLGGKERISRYDFARLVARVLKKDAVITAVTQKSVTMPAPRPADVSLDSSSAYRLGYEPRRIEDELRGLLVEAGMVA